MGVVVVVVVEAAAVVESLGVVLGTKINGDEDKTSRRKLRHVDDIRRKEVGSEVLKERKSYRDSLEKKSIRKKWGKKEQKEREKDQDEREGGVARMKIRMKEKQQRKKNKMKESKRMKKKWNIK